MNDEDGPNFKFIGMVAVAIVVLLVIFGGLAYLTFKMVSDVEVELGSIIIEIDDRTCNITAELDLSRDIEMESKDLRLVLEDSEIPLSYEDDLVWGEMNEEQFTEIVEKEEANIKGTAMVKGFFGGNSEKELDETIDLSFLGEILSSVVIEEAKLSTRFPFITIVNFNLTAEMDMDLNLIVKNSSATIDNGVDQHEVDLVHLNLRNDGTGDGKVEMPTATLISMALWGRNVTINAWGLETQFVFPFTS